MESIEKLISKAKIGMLQYPDSVFISTICFSLNTQVTRKVSTAATDGKNLLINPEFFEKLNPSERVFLLAHESLHVAYMHMIRKDDKDHKVWNMACDYVINDHLKAAGFHMPKGGLHDRRYKDCSSDIVYTHLMENPREQPQDFEPDLQDPTEGQGEEESEAITQEIQDTVIRANMQVTLSGGNPDQVPSEIQRLLADLLKPKVDWKTALARLLKSMSKSDYSFKKFNRKYLADEMYFPTLVSEGNLSRVDFAVDVSGSVTPQICTQFCSEIHSVLQHYSPEQIGVIQFGTQVVKTDVVRGTRDLLKLEFVDGGGTLISPVFREFEKSSAKALIILTDGHIWHRDEFKKPKGNRPIIWCIYDNPEFTCSFGKIIHFKL